MAVKAVSYRLESSGDSHPGLVRERNEDAWRQYPHINVYVLADGMGGHRAGDVASKEAVERVGRHLHETLDEDIRKHISAEMAMDVVSNAIVRVNEEVHALSRSSPELNGMGTTVCVLYAHGDKAVLGHVGDSRIYRFRKEKLEQLTQDHSLMREMLDEGTLDHSNIDSFKRKHVITRAIGVGPVVEPTIDLQQLEDGDLFLICSDGLSDLVSSREIAAILSFEASLDDTVEALIDAANKRGGVDNITVVLIKATGEQNEADLSR